MPNWKKVIVSGSDAILNQVTASSGILLPDDVKINFGDENDLQIHHDGSNSYIYDGGVGDLNIVATDLNLKAASDELYLTATSNGAVELYHDNSKKFETTSGGVSVTGNLAADGSQIDFTSLPTSDPGVAGRLFRSGNDVKISTG